MASVQSVDEFDDDEFRNSLGTMESTGKRKWIFAKKPPARKWYKYRTYVSWLLIALLFVIPFIKVNGNPFMKFDILKREFFIFGYPFFPQDLYLVAIGGIGTLVFIVLFTQIYGRLFCGWICPQTIFLEMVFRKIEFAIEGDRAKQMKLSRQSWNGEKIRKRALKWTIYLIISFAMAHIFLSYIVGADTVFKYIQEGPEANLSTFGFVLAFTGVFYFIFAWFREQACTLVCPYGRLQGVLVDKKTIAVTYDHKRGEGEKGRARFKKNENRAEVGKGDCIDCQQCVVVCPTGIDIRNGTQLECVNCTACMDACDDVMEKVGFPTGLIRYASEDNITKGEKFRLTPRHYAYSVVLLIIMSSFFVLLSFRSEVDSKFFRTPGMDYRAEGDTIVNQFNYVLINKTNQAQKLHMKMISHKGSLKILNHPKFVEIQKGEKIEGTLVIHIHKKDLKSYKDKIIIETIDDKGKLIDRQNTNFLGPFKYY